MGLYYCLFDCTYVVFNSYMADIHMKPEIFIQVCFELLLVSKGNYKTKRAFFNYFFLLQLIYYSKSSTQPPALLQADKAHYKGSLDFVFHFCLGNSISFV